MTKKDEAFKAFDAGKRPKDIQGVAKQRTLQVYYEEWKKKHEGVEVNLGTGENITAIGAQKGNPIPADISGYIPKVSGGVVPVSLPGTIEQPKDDGDKKTKPRPVVSPFLVSMYKMVPMQATIINTPIMWASYACAIAHGYKRSYEDFISLTMLDFWLGREINPFEELSVVFQDIPSTLAERIAALPKGGANEQGRLRVYGSAEEEEEESGDK